MNNSQLDIGLFVLQVLIVFGVGAYTIFTYRIMISTKEQARAITRPYVTIAARAKPNSQLLYLFISNTGHGNAENLRLSLDRAFHQMGREDPSNDIREFQAFKEIIGSFPPGQELAFILGSSSHLFGQKAVSEDLCPRVFSIHAKYEHAGEKYNETTIIDLRPIHSTATIQDAMLEQISRIVSSLNGIEQRLG